MNVTADDILKNIPDHILKKPITNTKDYFDKEYYLQRSTRNMMYEATFMNMTREELIETIRSIHNTYEEARAQLIKI